MTHKALASFDLVGDGVAISLVRREGSATLGYEFERPELRQLTPAERADGTPLRLSEDAARAVYEALGQYFGTAPDSPSALRQDYLAERARVDKLVDGVLRIATATPIEPVYEAGR